jgi:hypothetical protein
LQPDGLAAEGVTGVDLGAGAPIARSSVDRLDGIDLPLREATAGLVRLTKQTARIEMALPGIADDAVFNAIELVARLQDRAVQQPKFGGTEQRIGIVMRGVVLLEIP